MSADAGLFPAPSPVVAHRTRFAAVVREALDQPKPNTARIRAAQCLADRRKLRHPGESGAEVIESAANVAARQTCNLLRHGDTLTAIDYANAEYLLRERADRTRRISRDRAFRDAMKGWAA